MWNVFTTTKHMRTCILNGNQNKFGINTCTKIMYLGRTLPIKTVIMTGQERASEICVTSV